MNSVYMDNNATTSLKKEVLNAMMPYYTDIYAMRHRNSIK